MTKKDSKKIIQKNKYDVSVYYFPNYHLGDKRNEKWHGKGWTEWEVLKNARKRFKEQYVPKPYWGFEDESDPKIMEKKINFASKNGITNFIFDWYFYNDGPFLNKCLEKGFLKAKNRNNIKFSLMWANHDWREIHPASLATVNDAEIRACGDITAETFDKIGDYIIEKYFKEPNYYRLDGGLYFSIYEVFRFIKCLNGIEGAKKAIKKLRKKVKDKGLGKLHLNAITWGCTILEGESKKPLTSKMLKEIGFDSVTSYVWVHEHPVPEFPCFEYKKWMDICLQDFKKLTKKFKGIPYYPNITVGWDSSPRTNPKDKWLNVRYPFGGAIYKNTPEYFEESLREIKKQLDKSDLKTKMLTINAWNEWTEGSYLEPDTKYKDAKLKAIKKVFMN